VRSGGTFISVKTIDSAEGKRIAGILRERGADQVNNFQPAL
jgi:hypothetical protein